MAKLWQLLQSRGTKNLNVDKDIGWNDWTRTRRFWTQDEDEDE